MDEGKAKKKIEIYIKDIIFCIVVNNGKADWRNCGYTTEPFLKVSSFDEYLEIVTEKIYDDYWEECIGSISDYIPVLGTLHADARFEFEDNFKEFLKEMNNDSDEGE